MVKRTKDLNKQPYRSYPDVYAAIPKISHAWSRRHDFLHKAIELNSVPRENLVLEYLGNVENGKAVDTSLNGYDGTLNAVQVTDGICGPAFQFNGSGDYIDVGTQFEFSGNQLTFSCWFRSSQINTTDTKIFDVNATNRCALFHNSNVSGQMGVYIGAANDNFGQAPDDYEWHHLVYVLNGTSADCYLDNVQLGSTQTITSIDFSSLTAFVLGARYSKDSGFYQGKLANIRVYQSALSTNDIELLYKEIPVDVRCLSALRVRYTGDAMYGSTVDDAQGYKDGVQSNVTQSTGKDGQCFYFSGSSTYIDIGATNDYNDNGFKYGVTNPDQRFTVSMWVKSTQTGTSIFLFDTRQNSSSDPRFLIAWCSNVSNNVGLYDKDTWYSFGSNPNDGNWHHLVFTVQGATVKCYVDNSQLGSAQTLDDPPDLSGIKRANIGARWDESGANFIGYIDEFRFYTRVLSDDEIEYLASEYD